MTPKQTKDGRSSLWSGLAPQMSNAANDLSNFRLPGGPNSRLAHWEPKEQTLRWFKSYLLLCVESTPPPQREILKMLTNTGVGNPVTVTATWSTGELPASVELEESELATPFGIDINLDYLYAAEEVNFLQNALRASGGGGGT